MRSLGWAPSAIVIALTACSSASPAAGGPDATRATIDAPAPLPPNDAGPPPCPFGVVSCDGACTDLSRDRAHCGGCDLACADTQRCVSGRCDGPLGGVVDAPMDAGASEPTQSVPDEGTDAGAADPNGGLVDDPGDCGPDHLHCGPLQLCIAGHCL